MKFSIIIFVVLLYIFFIWMDLFVINYWKKYSKSQNYSKLSYQIPYLLAIIMGVLNLWVIVFRLTVFGTNSFIMLTFSIVSVWYVPKLIILPFLLLTSLKRKIMKFISVKFEKKAKELDDAKAKKREERRNFIRGASWTLAGTPFVMALHGAMNTVYDFEVKDIDIFIKDLPKGLEGVKIVQISDFHAGSFYSDKPVRKMRNIIKSIEPDILVMTGDFVNFHQNEFKHVYKEFSLFKAKYGVYGCLGNHEHYVKGEEHEALKRIIRNAGIDLIINDNREIIIKGSKLNLAGVDNWGRGQKFADFEGAMSKTDKNFPVVLLCHDPSNWRPRVRDSIDIDLMLSGHTHGGQIGFEYEGINLSPVQMFYDEYAGLYTHGDKSLYVNRGCGVVGPPIRIGIRPEISILRLRKQINLA